MYTGRCIEELFDVVAKAEEQAHRTEQMQLELRKSVQHVAGFSTHIYEPAVAVQQFSVA
jgi:hypothetical protein